jgi:hypothetical protein
MAGKVREGHLTVVIGPFVSRLSTFHIIEEGTI